MADPNALIAELSEDECWSLLVANEFGRLAVSIGDRPDIFPVNYHASDGSILFRTAEGTKLFGITVNHDVAFEIDDHAGADGWSVVVKGRARALETAADITEAEKAPLHPWTATVKRNFVRIDVSEVTGRRVTFGPEPESDYV